MTFWKYVSARAIAADLTEAGYPVSEDTVQRWKKRGSPDPRAADRVYTLLGIRQTTTKEPLEPTWLKGLESRLTDQIRENREVIVTALSGRIAEAVAEALAGLQPPPPDAQAPASADQAG